LEVVIKWAKWNIKNSHIFILKSPSAKASSHQVVFFPCVLFLRIDFLLLLFLLISPHLKINDPLNIPVNSSNQIFLRELVSEKYQSQFKVTALCSFQKLGLPRDQT
jgi:hypothetical protein